MKTLATAALIAMTTTTAMAETVRATITRVEPNYGYRQVDMPVQRCETVEVPIYGTVQGGGNATEGAIGGALIGGILGQALGGDKNSRNAGAIFGAIVGGDKAANGNRQVVTGYKTERQCHTIISTETERYIKNSKIYFTWNGIEGTAYTYNNYRTGQRIPVTVTLQAN